MSREVGKKSEMENLEEVWSIYFCLLAALFKRQWWSLWINALTSEINKFLQEMEIKKLEQFGAKEELM